MSDGEFRRIAATIDPDIAMSGPRSFDMVFSEESVNARATLALDDKTVVTDIYVHDVAAFTGGVRRSLLRALLVINAAAIRNDNYSVSIDSRHYLVLTGRLPLDRLSAVSFGDAIVYWLDLAQRLRDLAKAIAFEGGSLSFDLTPAQ